MNRCSALAIIAFAPSALRGAPVPNGQVELVGGPDADRWLSSPCA